MICAHEQCEHPRHALGLCDRHYRRMLAGEPITKPIRWQRRKPSRGTRSRRDSASPATAS